MDYQYIREAREKLPEIGKGRGQDKDKILQDLDSTLFNLDKPHAKPPAVIHSIGNMIASPGNLVCAMGPSKGGKSGLAGSWIAGAIRPEGAIVDSIHDIERSNGKLVAHYDCEQSPWNHYAFNEAVLKKAGLTSTPDYYKSYSLRTIDVKDRQEALIRSIQRDSLKCGGVHLIIADGVADFIQSPNDESEAYGVVSFFEKIAITYNCVVVLILHYNPGSSEKGRGHLGSQLERKCESVLSITKDQETGISTIEGKLLRNAGGIPKIQFEYDVEKGYHVSRGIITPVNKNAERKKEYEEIAYQIFEGGKNKYSHSELCEQIQDARTVGKPQAKKDITYMVKQCLITKPSGSKYYQLVVNIKDREAPL
jgi:hypothetical protein